MENISSLKQELDKPLPYKEMKVSFDNTEAEIILSGTLTLPCTENKHPIVILVSGSGALDRDSTFLGLKPFLIIADYLSRNGIAVLRYDKRGVGKSTGDFNSATPEDFTNDVLCAIEYLKSQKEIDKKRIGLIGHSEGGLIISMTASSSKDVAFIVMMAGNAMPIKENVALLFTLLVHEDKSNIQKFNDDRILFNKFFKVVTKNTLTPKEQKELIEIAQNILSRMNEESKATLGFSELPPEVLVTVFSKIPSIKGFLNSNPESYLTKLKCPVLAVYGDKDVQVPSKENIKSLKKALKQGKNEDYTIKEIPNLNHLFQRCKTGYPSEYQKIKETMSPPVLDLITEWISEKTK